MRCYKQCRATNLCHAGCCFPCALKARRAAPHGAGQRSACPSAWMREFGPARAMPVAQGIGAQRRRASGANGFADFCRNKSRPPKAEAFDLGTSPRNEINVGRRRRKTLLLRSQTMRPHATRMVLPTFAITNVGRRRWKLLILAEKPTAHIAYCRNKSRLRKAEAFDSGDG